MRNGFFVGNRVPTATPTAPTARFCIAQVRTRVGSTLRDVCAHVRAVGVSATGSLRNSLFPHRRVFSWATESRKRPPLPPPRGFASHKFVLALDRLFVTFAHMVEPLVCLLGPSETHFFRTGGFFHGQPSLESDPHCPHRAVLHRTSSYSRWIDFS